MSLKTLTESWLYLSRLLVVAACCGVATTSLAQNHWNAAGAPGSRYVQTIAYDASVTDMDDAQTVPGEGDTVIYEDGVDESELWDPTALGSDCGFTCPPAWRADFSYFALDRGSTEGLTLSPSLELGEDGHREGVRLTLARHFDCLDALELRYMGPFELRGARARAGAGLGIVPTAAGGVTLTSFTNATSQFQTYRTRFNSFEVNSKWVGWDVFTQTLGFRYWNQDHEFLFASTSAAGDGLLAIETDNNALGFQYGIEQLFPLGRWETNLWLKGGIFANIVDLSVVLTDAGTLQFANSDEDLDFSSLVETGVQVSLRVLPNVSVHAGYEVWWLYGFATGHEHLPGPFTPATGTRADTEDFWYHGGTAGVEIIW